MKNWRKVNENNFTCPTVGVISRDGFFNFWHPDQNRKWVLCLLGKGLYGPYLTAESAKRAARKRILCGNIF
jgi:hypothetical protein